VKTEEVPEKEGLGEKVKGLITGIKNVVLGEEN